MALSNALYWSMVREIPYSSMIRIIIRDFRDAKYLFAWQPLIILLVVLADTDQFRALEIRDLNSSRIAASRELDRVSELLSVHQLDVACLEELVTRIAAAGGRCILALLALLALLTLRCASIIILDEIVGLIRIGLIATTFARLCHYLGGCEKLTIRL
jgi:hypothetical protein